MNAKEARRRQEENLTRHMVKNGLATSILCSIEEHVEKSRNFCLSVPVSHVPEEEIFKAIAWLERKEGYKVDQNPDPRFKERGEHILSLRISW